MNEQTINEPWWIKLRTYNGLPFRYRQIQNGDCEIEYGSLPFKEIISSEVFREIRIHFQGKTVLLGASFDNQPSESLGAWLKEKLPGRNLALYIGSILVHEGYAEWGKTEEGACMRFLK